VLVFGYAVAVCIVSVLFATMLVCWLVNRIKRSQTSPANENSASAAARETGNTDTAAGRHLTRLVVVIVVVFAISWAPMEVQCTEHLKVFGASTLCDGYIRFNFDFDSTAVRRALDFLSKVIGVTVTEPASRSHADLFIYLGRGAAARSRR